MPLMNERSIFSYPAMPYPDYRNISDSDMHALYTYLMMQVAPVDEPPPHVTDLSFPFNLRLAMKGWNLLFLSKPDPSIGKAQTTEVYRGRYLVDTLGHCGSCHTPRNALMASDSSQYLAGGPLGGWHAPNITSDPVVGIGGWSVDELAGYLKNGHAAGRGQAAGGMAEAVEHSLSHLSDADLNAMAVYLKSVPAKSSPGQSKPAYGWGQTDTLHYEFDSESSRETLRDADMSSPYGTDGLTSRTYTFTEEKPSGARIYVNACASCHQPNGRGLEDQYYPSLSHNSTVGAENPNNLIMAVLKGIDRDSADGHTLMPGYENDLSNEQVAAVANYVMHRFGDPSAKPVTAEHVALLKAGGEKPLLARVSIWSKPAIAIAIVALLAIATLFWRKRRTRLSKLDPTL